ncbi:MAG: AAA family ATPase [Planctomycetes bacterium]|nr:AAA family ATPase [Planctomycetota bacterium]
MAPASQEETAPTGPLLGNEVAKRQAAEVLSAAKKGPAPLALVAGEKGVGKTRFGWEIQRLEGAKTFAHIRMPAAEGKGPYEALGSVAVSLVQVAQSSFPDWIGQAGPLVTLAPALAAGEPHKDAAKLLDAFERFLRGLSERMPLALFFDDADRLPSESWAALSHLARRGIGGLAIFAAVRGESLPSGWKELEKEKKGVTIRLRPIPEGLLKPLVQQILGPPAVSEVLVREVAFITEGVPLFVGEFLKIGKRKGFVFPEGDRWSTDLDRRARYVEDSLPPELEEKLVATARSLPPSHQKALGLLAMMPGPASAGEIGIASPIPASQLSVVLADLVAKRLVVKRTIEKVALHALTAKRVREAFSGIFPQKEARAAHEKFARHLEKLAAEGKKVSAEALAHHFDGAGTLDRAAQYLLAAGEEALAAGRVQRAAELLLRAREDSDALVATGKGKKSFLGGLFAKGTDLTKVHGLLGDAYLRLGKNEEALASLQRAIAEGDPKKEPERLGVHRGLGTAYLKLGNYGEAEKHLAAAQAKGAASSPDIDCYLGQLHLARDRYDPAREVVERALASLGEKGDPELRALAHHELGRSLYLGGRWEDAHAHWTIEREILQQQGLEFHLPRNLAAVALYRLRRGRILGALELLERARLFAAKTENREIEPRIHHGFGAVYLVRDEVARAFLEFQHGLEKANELHQPDRTARLVQGLGLAYLAAGKIHEALDHCAKGQELFERLRFRRGLADNHHLRGRISMASGNGSMAEQHFGYALKEYKEIGTSWRLPPLYLSYHRLNRALGRKDQSEKFLKEAERIARSTDDRTSLSEVFRTHAEVFQERGDEEKSDEYLKRAVEALKET